MTYLKPRRGTVVICDVSAVTHPDVATVEALARLQLTARRLGCEIRIYRAHRRLRDLIAFTGLGEVLPDFARSAVETVRQAEQREQVLGVQEGVDSPDPAV